MSRIWGRKNSIFLNDGRFEVCLEACRQKQKTIAKKKEENVLSFFVFKGQSQLQSMVSSYLDRWLLKSNVINGQFNSIKSWFRSLQIGCTFLNWKTRLRHPFWEGNIWLFQMFSFHAKLLVIILVNIIILFELILRCDCHNTHNHLRTAVSFTYGWVNS